MADIKSLKELLYKTVHAMTGSEDVYKDFLKTAAWNYKYILPDQLMIFAQNKDAIACAGYDVWREKLDRGVKRKSRSILLFNDEGKIIRLFDVADTYPLSKPESPFSLWELEEGKETVLKKRLQEAHGLPVAWELYDVLKELASEALIQAESEDYEEIQIHSNKDKEHIDNFITDSILYMVYHRLGILNEKEFDFSGFLNNADSTAVLSCLSTARICSEDILRKVGSYVKEISPKPVVSKIKKEDYYYGRQNQLQSRGQLFDTGLLRREREESKEIRTPETEISSGDETGSVHTDVNERGIADASDEHSRGSGSEIRTADGSSVKEPESTEQRDGSNGVGGSYEQPKTSGRGSNPDRDLISLEDDKGERNVSIERFYYIIKNSTFFHHDQTELASLFLSDGANFDEKMKFLKETFNEEYSSLLTNDETCPVVGYKKNPYASSEGPFGVEFWEGAGYPRERTFLTWSEVYKEVEGLAKSGQLLNTGVKTEEITLEAITETETGDVLTGVEVSQTEADLPVFSYPQKEERVPEEYHEYFIFYDDVLLHTNEEINSVLSDPARTLTEKKEYLISSYKAHTHFGVPHPSDKNGNAGMARWSEGLYINIGDGEKILADSLLPWDDVLAFRLTALENKKDVERVELKAENPESIDEKEADEVVFTVERKEEEKEPEYDIDTKGKVTIRDWALEAELCRGSGISQGKYRIFTYFTGEHTKKEYVDFLKDEYGMGGHSMIRDSAYSFVDHDAKGLHFKCFDNRAIDVTIGWPAVADKISELIKEERYLNEKEVAYYPIYLNQRDTRALANKIHGYFKQYFEDYTNADISELLSVSAQEGYGYMFPYEELYEALINPFMRPVIGDKLFVFRDTLPEGPAKNDLSTLLLQLEDLPYMQEAANVSWSRRDWDLLREAESVGTDTLRLEEDNEVVIAENRYLVLEKKENAYLLQDINFPIFTRTLSKEELITLLKENSSNDVYFEAGDEKKEAGNSIHHRNFRLFKELVPDIFYNKREDVCYRLSETTELHIGRREHGLIAIQEFHFSSHDKDHKEEPDSEPAILFFVDENEEELIPVHFTRKSTNQVVPLLDEADDLKEDLSLHLSVYVKYWLDGLLDLHLGPEKEISIEDTKERSGAEERDDFIVPEEDNIHSRKEDSPSETDESDTESAQLLEKENITLTEKQKTGNYVIKNEALGEGGPKEKYAKNIKAIRLLKELEKDGRYARSDEQEILANYVGWGGLSDAFDKTKTAWQAEYEELKALLSEDEYMRARESTLTAFYTPPVVISSIYNALENMGFTSGNILEPSCGTGHFFGMLPENMKESNLYGVELDPISGRIAKQLYQDANIKIEGFEKTDLPDHFFDVVIGNVPFGQFSVDDARYRNYNFMIHDYFFAKALDKVRPGGIIAFVTSKGTMDKSNSAVRKYIAERADLLGAIRLPNDTFTKNAGTKATSDILFLQKRDRMQLHEPDWIKATDYGDGFLINQYFLNHPEMVLGELKVEKGQAGREDLVCLPIDIPLKEQLDSAMKHIRGEYVAYELEDVDANERTDEKEAILPADPNIQNFGYAIVNDVVYQRRDSKMYPVVMNATALDRIRGLVTLRELTRELITAQMEDKTNDEIKALQVKLNTTYDDFVSAYGYINSRGNSIAFSDDSSYFLLCSLEIFDEDGNFKRKADMFHKRTIKKHEPITHAATAVDALGVCIGEKARVDLDFMQGLMGADTTKESIIKDLTGVIFQDPEISTEEFEGYVTASEYLSGNVKEKLRIAREYTAENESFNVNVEALLSVQPKDLDATEISVRLGSTWIPADIVTEFVEEIFDLPEHAKRDDYWGRISVIYEPVSDTWEVKNAKHFNYLASATKTYGTSRRDGFTILDDCLNLKQSQVMDYWEEDGKRKQKVNHQETMIAQQKQELLKDEFVNWVWKDPDRRARLVRLYNDKFNNLRPREYDGEHIIFHGISPEITLRDHQKDAIARVLYGGNTLLAHAVGAGKTWEMTAAAMESKHLGLCTKSMFVVPNHLIGQWASEFLQLYPSANLLVATKKDFETKNRKKFCARIATGNYDAVILGHSQFGLLPLSRERQERLLRDQIDEITEQIAVIKKEENAHVTVKQLERTRKSLQLRLDKLNNAERKDDVITFEELGIDRLFIDEFHYFKNLFLYTKMQNISGISQTAAQKSQDLYMKGQYLDELTGYRGLIGATGTPITNSMTELFTMQRYFASDKLAERGLSSFDSWASTFGETVTAVELAPEGTNYRAKTRFAKFYNLPELISMYKEFADVKTADVLNLDVPEVENICIDVDPSEEQRGLLESLVERAEKVRNGVLDPTEDNMLKITNDGRKLALDQRLLDITLPDNENSKVNACVREVYKIYEETKDQKLTQLIFCDLSTPTGRKKKPTIVMEEKDGVASMVGLEDSFENVYEDIKHKLINLGVPENEIAFIHDATTDKQKDALFANVRAGKVRILLGSTSKMGAGTNVQDLIIASHDLDCPWRPADLEQRAGRTVRQGNTNPKVKLYRYVTKDTFDAYLWQIVENKQNFISQIQTSKSPVRIAEDVDEKALEFAEIKALASGNPLIKEKMDLDVEVHKLNALKANFLRNKYSLEDDVTRRLPKKIADSTTKIECVSKDIAYYEEQKSEDFEISIHGKNYTDQTEAGKAFMAAMEEVTSYEPTLVGFMNGFDIKVSYSRFLQAHKIYLKNAYQYSFDARKSGHGNLNVLTSVFESFDEMLNTAKEELENAKKALEQAQKELKREFPYEEKLRQKNQRLSELNIILNVESGAGPEELLHNAKDVNTSPEILSQMAGHDDVAVREAVAGNASTPLEALLALKEDTKLCVKQAAYLNTKMPPEQLSSYIEVASEEDLSSLLKHKELSEKSLLQIEARGEDNSNFLYLLAKHPNGTSELYDRLSQRNDEYLSRMLINNAKKLNDKTFERLYNSTRHYQFALEGLLRREDCPEALLLRACDEDGHWLKRSLIERKTLPESVLKVLATSVDSFVASRAKSRLKEVREKDSLIDQINSAKEEQKTAGPSQYHSLER